jgi:hypothetical protein
MRRHDVQPLAGRESRHNLALLHAHEHVPRPMSPATSWLRISPRARTATKARTSASPRCPATSFRDLSRGKRGTTHRSHSCVVQTRPLIPHNAASHASRSGGNRGMYGPCSHTAKNDATGRLPNPPLASTAIRLPRGESGGLPSPYRLTSPREQNLFRDKLKVIASGNSA